MRNNNNKSIVLILWILLKKLSTKRIHIAPVGFEIDRIVEPAIEDKADLVYLILHKNKSEDKATSFADIITKKLNKKRISVQNVYADRFDLFEIIKEIKQIIERDRKQEYLINVASGSKIHSIACMMALMIFDDRSNLKPFYAIPKKYHSFELSEQQTYGVEEIQELPTYRIQTPSKSLIKILTVIKGMINKSNNKQITKKELVAELEDLGLIETNKESENHKMAKYTTLDKKVIKPLKEVWGYIDEEKVGRNRRIFFTSDGEAASKFLF